MSISSAFGNALSGLTTTARNAEIISSNLSNAQTDGYGRRTLEVVPAPMGGVSVKTVIRHVDAGILADRRLADASLGGQDRTAQMLTRLEQVLGGPDDPAGLNGRLAAFERSLISAASDPASEVRLSEVVSRLDDLVDTLRNNTRNTQAMRVEADTAINRDIEVLNAALLQVQDMNKDIVRISATGGDVLPLIDARQTVVDRIASIVPVRELTRENGTIGLMTTSGTLLLDGRAMQFGFTPTPTITADMTLASGALSGITVDGVPLDPATGIGRLDGGSLGAAFAMRDSTLVEVQEGLDTIAADLIARFQDPANDPTLAAGDLGLLTDEGLVLDPSDLAGLAGRITINPAINPDQGGNVTFLRDGLNAAAPGPVGNAAQLDNWVAALRDSRADVPGARLYSAASRVANFTSEVGNTRLIADEQLSYTAARWDTLKQAELADGVDTDQELQKLLQVEQAYAANAKVIQTLDAMMQSLMGI